MTTKNWRMLLRPIISSYFILLLSCKPLYLKDKTIIIKTYNRYDSKGMKHGFWATYGSMSSLDTNKQYLMFIDYYKHGIICKCHYDFSLVYDTTKKTDVIKLFSQTKFIDNCKYEENRKYISTFYSQKNSKPIISFLMRNDKVLRTKIINKNLYETEYLKMLEDAKK